MCVPHCALLEIRLYPSENGMFCNVLNIYQSFIIMPLNESKGVNVSLISSKMNAENCMILVQSFADFFKLLRIKTIVRDI